MNTEFSAYASIIIAICIASLVALACAQEGLQIGGLPVLFICLGIAFLFQWLIFIPSLIWKTEHFFDLTGSITFLTVISIAYYYKSLFLVGNPDTRSIMLALLVSVWAIRLGGFLFMRIRRSGEDRRFRKYKKSLPLFLRVWTLQGLWVFITCLAALTAITSTKISEVDLAFYLGLGLWVFGFIIEVIADTQKNRFGADKKNKGKFIRSGLWAFSRHPNYLGEIILWLGIATISLPVLQGWQYVSILSPFFVYLILTKVSGIPILEVQAEKDWGKEKDYQIYKKKTPLLFPQVK